MNAEIDVKPMEETVFLDQQQKLCNSIRGELIDVGKNDGVWFE